MITRSARAATVAAGVAAACLAVAACGGGDDSESNAGKKGEEIVITCSSCLPHPTNAFETLHNKQAEAFNKKYAGRYRIDMIKNQFADGGAERLQYYQRLALADDLADLFTVNPGEVAKLRTTGKLRDFAPALSEDGEWNGGFYDDAFAVLAGDDGETWGIPQTRDAIGVYYNKALFDDAGVDAFPETWDDVAAACEKIKSSGKACLAMDGDWTTLLMWANLIGTDPAGAEFLSGGIAEGGYEGNPAVVKATETLKGWHTSGYTNEDAFSGDYTSASTAFLRSDAAMIANGPWMVPVDIKGKDAPKDLYGKLGYEPSPGWTADQRGVIIVAGEGSWASGTTDETKQEAVDAFLKFVTSREEGIAQVRDAGAYPAVQLDLTDEEIKTLEPLGANLVRQSAELPLTYPHAYFRAPAGFSPAWKNLWPAYVKGELDTQEFLTRLGNDATSPTG
jgi:raffinose/stachyose/melibiose transport system substrate-binding protein